MWSQWVTSHVLLSLSGDCGIFDCRFEKMISGMYLGEIARQALLQLVKDGALFGGKLSDQFDKFQAFETEYISLIEAG